MSRNKFMKTGSNSLSAFLTYFLCIFTYFVAIFLNIGFIDEYLQGEAISFTEYDNIELFKLYGYIAATVILLIFARFFSYRKIILCNLSIYWLSIFNITFLDLNSLRVSCLDLVEVFVAPSNITGFCVLSSKSYKID